MSDKLISLESVLKETRRFRGYIDDDMIERFSLAFKRLPSVELPMSAVEFGKTRERLCRTCSCSSCPLMNIYTGCKYHEINDDTVAIVEKWSREHPEVVNDAD